MKIVVISADYPSADFVYGDVFVHTRSKQYQQVADVHVVGFNRNLTADRNFIYEGIPALVTTDIDKFYSAVRAVNADVIVGHFVQGVYLDLFI